MGTGNAGFLVSGRILLTCVAKYIFMEKEQLELIYGFHAVLEAIEAGQSIDKIWVQQEGGKSSQLQALWQAARAHGIPVLRVPRSKIQQLVSKGSHQGVLAFMAPIAFANLEHILDAAFGRGEVPLLLMLDKVNDVRNFGAIARTAEAVGVHAIIIGEKGVARINQEAVKTSAGALMHVPVCRVQSLVKTARFLKDSGLQLVACTEKENSPHYAVNYRLPSVIILGSEEKGISRELLELADAFAKIPMRGKVSSLNVSVSAGVVLYEALRQRDNSEANR